MRKFIDTCQSISDWEFHPLYKYYSKQRRRQLFLIELEYHLNPDNYWKITR